MRHLGGEKKGQEFVLLAGGFYIQSGQTAVKGSPTAGRLIPVPFCRGGSVAGFQDVFRAVIRMRYPVVLLRSPRVADRPVGSPAMLSAPGQTLWSSSTPGHSGPVVGY